MKKNLETIQQCPLFYGISPQDILQMLTCFDAKIAHFDKQYTVFAEGSAAHHIGIVLSGCVQIVQIDLNGNRSLLGEATAGDMFGEAFACADVEVLPIAVVASKPSDILLIRRERLLHPCQNHCGFHNQIVYNLMKELALKNIRFHERLYITSKRTTREKLLTYLALQSQKANSTAFRIPFNRQELADYLEVDRSGLSAEISKLRQEGVLNSQRQYFELL